MFDSARKRSTRTKVPPEEVMYFEVGLEGKKRKAFQAEGIACKRGMKRPIACER